MNIKIIESMKDKDLMNIAYSAAKSFKSTLTKEEIEYCIINALWKSLKSYKDDENSCKFSSYLYNSVNMECLAYRKMNISHRVLNVPQRIGNLMYPTFETVDMLDEIAHCDDPDIMFDKYYNNMTIMEIAKNRSTSRETIRKKIKKNLRILKLKLN